MKGVEKRFVAETRFKTGLAYKVWGVEGKVGAAKRVGEKKERVGLGGQGKGGAL